MRWTTPTGPTPVVDDSAGLSPPKVDGFESGPADISKVADTETTVNPSIKLFRSSMALRSRSRWAAI